MPKVSVIVPNYNHAPFLQERMGSILNQIYQDFEVIILDDCSTDNSREIIESYRTHPKVSKIIYNDINSGNTFVQWNKGIEQARGEWIWIAESDDVADVSLLENLIHLAEQDENIVLSYCQSYKIDAEGKIIGNWIDWTEDLDDSFFKRNFTIVGYEYIKKFLHYKNTIPNASAVIFKKESYFVVDKANIDVPFCADWLLWLKLLTIGNIAYYAIPLNYFREHKNSVIATVWNNEKVFRYKYDIILRKKFIYFLEKKSDLESKELIQIFKKDLSQESEFEIKYLINNCPNKENLNKSWHYLKNIDNKISIFCFLIKKGLFILKNKIMNK